MHGVDVFVGRILDEKYRLERLLGQGGMGAVYLATHLGTGRSVAVKLITPALMRRQVFVERFKREARAAGRLRHPNIVDVTDFGFARSGHERIAYLVMEYLDGCTLHDVLEEERVVPLPWAVEILEQVCSAVHEAHRQGIVHRDLKPENIWLEPNRLGGYRVKVLDFGIAKVAEGQLAGTDAGLNEENVESRSPLAESPPPGGINSRDDSGAGFFEVSPEFPTILEAHAETRADPASPETAAEVTSPSMDLPAVDLTHGGALVGTPKFMSPEQCRGERLDARSDIYSLGVIAYQMLAGTTPFSGEAGAVLRAHREEPPPSLKEHNPLVPDRVCAVIGSALSKDPSGRPPSALAFVNALRANATGLGALYRRAFVLYCEHFPKVLMLSLLAHLPVLAGVMLTVCAVVWESQINGMGALGAAMLRILIVVVNVLASFVAASTIAGVTAILVTQLEVAPLRRLELRSAFGIVRRRWRPFVRTGLWVCVRLFIGFVLLVIPGMFLLARQLFWAPVVLMEGLEGRAARNRSRELASRSWPAVLTGVMFLVGVDQLAQSGVGILIGLDVLPKNARSANVLSKVVPLASILYLPLVSMVPALLYLKMRELGGETLTEIMAQLDTGRPRSRWEQRMRSRLPLITPPKAE